LTTAATLDSGESATISAPSVTCAGDSTTISGATVDVLGSGATTIRGSVVKIN
jgi:hypothetical protein